MTDPVKGDIVYVDGVPHWAGKLFELACQDLAFPDQWVAHGLTKGGKRFKPGRFGGPPIYSIPLSQCRRAELVKPDPLKWKQPPLNAVDAFSAESDMDDPATDRRKESR